jgi:hypothetical protein
MAETQKLSSNLCRQRKVKPKSHCVAEAVKVSKINVLIPHMTSRQISTNMTDDKTTDEKSHGDKT